MSAIILHMCPSCGSEKIKKIRGNLTREFDGKKYTVSNVEYHECPDCGERIYGREAIRKIQAKSPAFRRQQTR